MGDEMMRHRWAGSNQCARCLQRRVVAKPGRCPGASVFSMSRDQSAIARKRESSMSPEQRSERSRRGHETRRSHGHVIATVTQERLRQRLVTALHRRWSTFAWTVHGDDVLAASVDPRNVDVLRAFCNGWLAGVVHG